MNEPITSFAAFKRRLAQADTVSVTNFYNPKMSGPRRILKCQTGGFWWWNPACGIGQRSWTKFPPAKDVLIDGPDQVTFFKENGTMLLTITFDNPKLQEG